MKDFYSLGIGFSRAATGCVGKASKVLQTSVVCSNFVYRRVASLIEIVKDNSFFVYVNRCGKIMLFCNPSH